MTGRSDPLTQFILPVLKWANRGVWFAIGLGVGWLIW
jgi:hypothetical protein